MAATPSPTTITAITPGWLAAALRRDGCLGDAVVTRIGAVPLGEGSAILSNLARLALTYEPPDAGPRTLIAKVPTDKPANRHVARGALTYQTEVNFYRQLADRSPLRVPHCYAAELDETSGDFVLLLEDLDPARTVDPLTGCTPAEAETVIVALSRLHAAWWNHPELAGLTGFRSAADPQVMQSIGTYFRETWPRFRERFGDSTPAPALATMAALSEQMAAVVGRTGGPPQTICHGDVRVDNIFFDLPDSPIAVVDWQYCRRASGLFDVADFLVYNLDVATRRSHEHELLRRYHQGLREGGVADFSFERCLEDFRWAVLYWNQRAIITSVADPGNARGAALFASFRERCIAANQDWDTGALLRSLEPIDPAS
jgi:aminoglycoside/choline kinase family phosphotransferase